VPPPKFNAPRLLERRGASSIPALSFNSSAQFQFQRSIPARRGPGRMIDRPHLGFLGEISGIPPSEQTTII